MDSYVDLFQSLGGSLVMIAKGNDFFVNACAHGVPAKTWYAFRIGFGSIFRS
jgi:hypothetical protein